MKAEDVARIIVDELDEAGVYNLHEFDVVQVVKKLQALGIIESSENK